MSHIVLFKRIPNETAYEKIEPEFLYPCRKGLSVSSFESLGLESPASNLILISLGLGWRQLLFAALQHWLSTFWRWDQDSPFCRAGDLSPSRTARIPLDLPIISPALRPLGSSVCSLPVRRFSSFWGCLLVLLPLAICKLPSTLTEAQVRKISRSMCLWGLRLPSFSAPNLHCCCVAHKSMEEMESKGSK